MDAVDDYGWRSVEGSYSCAYVAPRVVSILRRLRARRVLDLGAGNGAICRELSRAGFEVVGVEQDACGVAIARQANPQIAVYQLGIQDDPGALLAREAEFDAVVSTEVIEHLYAPHLLPAFARSTLVRGGHLVITTPYHGYLKNLALAALNKWDHHHTALWHGGHIKFFSRRTLTQLIEANGFRVTQFGGVGRLPYFWKSMVLVAQLA